MDWQEQYQEWLCQIPSDVRTAHTHCRLNRGELTQSGACGCFYCGAIFPPAEIEDWIDPAPEMVNEVALEGQTARCPRCGIDSVIGDQSGYLITRDFLEKMTSYWF
jgi:hypothetical protein